MDMDFFKEVFSQLDIRLVIGIVVVVVVYTIEIILTNKKLIGQRGKKRIERARKKGHVIEAHLINGSLLNRETNGDSGFPTEYYYGKYVYTINGVKKTKTKTFKDMPAPNTIYFYYDNNPSRLYTEVEFTTNRFGFLLLIIPWGVAALVVYLLGYRG